MDNTEFTIKYSNKLNELYFKLSIECISVVFVENKNSDLNLERTKIAIISDDGKLVTQIEDES